MKTSPRLILGIDPGYGRLGWAVVSVAGSHLKRIASGCIHTPIKTRSTTRLTAIHATLQKIVAAHRPTEVAAERLYFQRNTSTAVGVGEARGVALLIAGQHGLSVREFSPTDIKLAVTGYGRADKRQITLMVKAILHLPTLPTSDDEADALAIAICAAAHRPNYAS